MDRQNAPELSREMEKESWDPDLRVDYIRHGSPTYTEEEHRSLNFQGVIKESDQALVKEAAQALASTIDPEREVAVIWETKKTRGKETSVIYQQVLQGQGIPILEIGGKLSQSSESLVDLGLSPKLVQMIKDKGTDNWMRTWMAQGDDVSTGAETPAELKKRSMRVLANIERTARLVHPAGGKKLRFLVFGHEEGVRDLLETSLGVGTDKGTGPGYTERVHVEIKGGIPGEDKPARLKVSFRDKTSFVDFDVNRRELKSPTI